MPNYYEMLGVERNASQEAIERGYKSLAIQNNSRSDRTPEEKAAIGADLNIAHAVLTNNNRKLHYDNYLRKYPDATEFFLYVLERKQEKQKRKKREFRWRTERYFDFYEAPAELSFETLEKTWIEVFAPDSFDLIYGTFNQESVEEILVSKPEYNGNEDVVEQDIENYRRDWLVILTTLLGLPNYCELGAKFTWRKLLKNIANVEFDKVWYVNLLSWVLSPIFIAWHLAVAPFRFVKNILKVVTEYLPTLGAKVFARLGYLADEYSKRLAEDHNISKARSWAAWIFLSIPAHVMSYLFFTVDFVFGRSLTSPVDAVRLSWKTGFEGVKHYGWEHPLLPQISAYAGAFFLVLLRILLISTMFGLFGALLGAVMGPQLVALAVQIAAMIPQHAPLILYSATHLPETLDLIGQAIATIGPVVNRVVEYIKYEWNNAYDEESPRPVYKHDVPQKHENDISLLLKPKKYPGLQKRLREEHSHSGVSLDSEIEMSGQRKVKVPFESTTDTTTFFQHQKQQQDQHSLSSEKSFSYDNV